MVQNSRTRAPYTFASSAHVAAGQTLVAAPVLGRPDLAASGQLGVVVAAPEDAVQRCEPLLQVIGRRTFVATNTGYRLEIHPPRDWLEELLDGCSDFALGELQLLADEPAAKAEALAGLLELDVIEGSVVDVGSTRVRFVAGGPPGRPQLHGELFL